MMSGEAGGGPLDLNGNGSGLDEIVFFAAVNDANERVGVGCRLAAAAACCRSPRSRLR